MVPSERSDISNIASKLAKFLDENRMVLSRQWAQQILELPDFQGCQPLEKGFRSWTERGISAIIEKLIGEASSAFEKSLFDLFTSWQDVGLGNCDSIVGLLQIRPAALSLPWDIRKFTPEEIEQCTELLDEVTAYLACRLAEIHAEEIEVGLREQHERMALLLRMAEMANSTLDLHKVLCTIDEVMAPILGRVAFYDVYDGKYMDVEDPSGEIIDHPVDAFTLEPVERKVPVVCYDAATDPRTHKPTVERFGLKSLLALPIMAKGKVVAVALVVPSMTEYKVFSEEEIELAWGIVNTAAMAIENARLYQEAERLAVVEERSRIARDLHDESDQLITGALCVIQAAQEAIRRDRTTQALSELDTAKKILRQIDARNRLIVSGLRSIALGDLRLGEAFELYFQDFRERYKVACTLEIAGSYRDINEDVSTAAFRIVQEALTNVALHSNASSVSVFVNCEPQRLQIVVEDDGIGFDVNTIEMRSVVNSGISGMQDRAQRVGGTVEIKSDGVHGTRVIINLPYANNGGSAQQSE
jgi:signal transduction histidine kinase